MKPIKALLLPILLLIVTTLTAWNLRAANQSWTGSSTNANWTTGPNWQSGNVPAANDLLFFGFMGSQGALLTNDIAAGRIFNGLTYQSTGDPLTISGNSIGLNGGITNSGTATQVINNPIVLSANGTVNAASPVTLGGAISGNFNLTKIGTSTLTLSGANSYGGSLFVNAGTVKATASGALETTNPIVFTGATAATLDIQGLFQTLTNLVVTNNTTVTSAITITGTSGSVLNCSPATLYLAPLAPTNTLTLNMSGLGTFIYSNTTGTLQASVGLVATSAGTGGDTVTLAGGTNLITAANLNVGNNSPSSSTPATTFNLGTNNIFNVGTINAGSGRGGDAIQFASGITNGTLAIYGTTGPGSLCTWVSGNHDSFSPNDKPVDLVDVTAGTLNAQLNTITIGKVGPTANMVANRGVTVTSSFKMGAGTLNVATMNIGLINAAVGDAGSFAYIITNTALLSITNGGTANITNLNVALNSYAGNLGNAPTGSVLSATVNLNGGSTLNATTIQKGTIATQAAGVLTVTSLLSWGDGTIGNIPGGNLTINTVSFVMSGSGNTHKFNISSGQSGSINAWITGTGTITDVGAGALNLTGQNSFTGSLIMASTNTLTITGVNTYSGSTTISNGVLALSGAGSISSPTINISSNAVFDASALGTYNMAANQSIVGNGSVTGSISAPLTAQIIPGAAGVAGTLAFSNDLALNGHSLTFDLSTNPASGNDQINVSGTFAINANTTIVVNQMAGSLGVGTYTLMNYGAINTNSFNLVLFAPRGVTLNVGATALTLTVTGSGSGNLIWTGDGVANNWDVLTTTDWLNAGSPDFFYQDDNVTFDDTGSVTPAVNLTTTLTPASVLVTNSGSYTFSGPGLLTGSMTLTKNGTGTLVLATTNTYTGGTVVSNGIVELDNASAAGTGAISLGANVLNVKIGGTTLANAVSGTGTINVTEVASANTTFGGSLSNFTGVINLPANPGGTAKAQITGSVVNISSNATIVTASGGTLYLNAVTVAATNNVSGTGNSENLGALRVDGGSIVSGPVNLQGNTSIGENSSGSGTISGVIGDGNLGYGITKVGGNTSTLILLGANTYTGGTTISNGTLQVGNNLVAGILPGDVLIATNNAALSFIVPTNATQVYGGTISGPGSLIENGFGGTLVLNGINSFTNTVNVTAGDLWITNSAALGTGAKIIKLDNGSAGLPQLHLNGTNGDISLPATFTLSTSSSSAISVINEAGNNVINGPISATSGGGDSYIAVNGGFLTIASNITLAAGVSLRSIHLVGSSNGIVLGVIASNSGGTNFSFYKAGTGTWTLAGTNTYNGITTVSAGTLLVNGVIGTNTVTVATNATLGGSGLVNGAVTVQTGGIMQGGDANYTNTLTVTNLTLGNGSGALTYSTFKIATGGKIAANTLAINGTNIINILDTSLAAGTNTLFTYGGGSIGGSGFTRFHLGTVPVGVTAQLLNTGSAVQLVTTVGFPPVVTVTPASTNVFALSSATFTANISSGTVPFTYQWYDNHTNVIAAATNSTLTLTNLAVNQSGNYTVAVTNLVGGTSAFGTLTVNALVAPTVSSTTALGGGGFQLSFSGPVGETFKVIASTNLTLPIANWTVLTNGTFGAGSVTFTDTTATNYPQQYYLITAP